MSTGLQELLETEYAFGERARTSVRSAFLEYLAEDSLILQPGPVPGRPFYTAAQDNDDTLEWYPTIAEAAGSNDLGFTSGPWVYTVAAGGVPLHGHFLSLWKRDDQRRWRVEFDGGISHDAPARVESKLRPDSTAATQNAAPPGKLIDEDALGHAITDFEVAAQENGMAAGLRTYARNGNFRLYIDAELPMELDAAVRYLDRYRLEGSWKEVGHGRSADSTLAYSVGELNDANDRSKHAFVQIWQYDPKVSNWGLRILLATLLPAPTIKS